MHSLLVICTAILAVLVMALGLWVSIARVNSNVITGVGNDPTSAVMKAVRAHANASEYAGVLMALFVTTALVYKDRDLGAAVFWTVVALTAARVIHAVGFLTCSTLEKPHPLKAVGATVTYLGGIILAKLLVLKVV